MTRKYRRIIYIILVLIIVVWIVWGNVTIGTTKTEIQTERLPASFDGFKIVQVSDLHGAGFGQEHARLMKILREEQADIIVLTGDLMDSDRQDLETAASFVRQAAEIAPCFFVTGNHEAWLRESYKDLEAILRNCGVTVLHNRTVRIEKDGEFVQLAGIDDPDFSGGSVGLFETSGEFIASEIRQAGVTDSYSILLSHRPEAFETYCESGIDLVLCGHAHGGQFRLPLIGGIIAPGQGLFPKYDSGVYQKEHTAMVVSRGLGNSVIPVRINNRPEVVTVILRGEH